MTTQDQQEHTCMHMYTDTLTRTLSYTFNSPLYLYSPRGHAHLSVKGQLHLWVPAVHSKVLHRHRCTVMCGHTHTHTHARTHTHTHTHTHTTTTDNTLHMSLCKQVPNWLLFMRQDVNAQLVHIHCVCNYTYNM